MNIDAYTIDEHLHRYACWTAARAASIGRFKNSEIEGCFLQICLREKVQHLKDDNFLTHESYSEWFITTCEQLMEVLSKIKTKDKERKVSFGIAAKLISIYIKTVEVLPSSGKSHLSAIAFPPIDSILLKNLKQKEGLQILSTSWSNTKKDAFMALVHQLKAFIGREPFWKLEVFWQIKNNNGKDDQ